MDGQIWLLKRDWAGVYVLFFSRCPLGVSNDILWLNKNIFQVGRKKNDVGRIDCPYSGVWYLADAGTNFNVPCSGRTRHTSETFHILAH